MRLIIADSNEIVRIGLRTVLASEANVEIVGEAKTSAELFELVKSFGTDLVLIDYTSAGFSIDIIPQVLQKFPNVQIVAITPEQSAQTLVNALRSGVKSYVKKDCDSSEIILSVKETWRGNKFFCGQILETIRDASIDVNDIDFEAFSCEPVTLSERELEIITLIAEGLTNNQTNITIVLKRQCVLISFS